MKEPLPSFLFSGDGADTPIRQSVWLAVIVPCYNEEAVLRHTISRLMPTVEDLIARGKIGAQSHIYFVDDGSTDQTWSIVEEAAVYCGAIAGVKLSRNFGHQNALLAGLAAAEGDAFLTMDADLQDDVGVIERMVEEFRRGRDIVYGVRSSRKSDRWFKRLTGHGFYGVMRWMGVEIVPDHADCRLLSRRAVNWLRKFGEADLFLRGLVPKLSANASTVYYERQPRLHGETKYSLAKMLSFAWRGITTTTAFPLRCITALGFVIFSMSLVMIAQTIYVKLFNPAATRGWASTLVAIYFLGGLQVLSLGIIGEYIAKVFVEAKRRPRFLIEASIRAKTGRRSRRRAAELRFAGVGGENDRQARD